MKDIEAYVAKSELLRPFRIAYDVITHVETVFVKVVTDEGIDGWGEAIPAPKITGDSLETIIGAIKYLKRTLAGMNVLEYRRVWHVIESSLKGNYSAKAGIVNALADALGKYLGQPLYKLLGGWSNEFETDVTLSLDEPEVMADEAAEWVKKGFRILKIKLGGPISKDIERVRAVRERVGDAIELRVDANQAWSLKDAVKIISEIEKYGVTVIEQPLPASDLSGLKLLREVSPIPIVLDESVHTSKDAALAIKLGACDGVNVKIAKAGGIIESLKIAEIVKSNDLKLMVGCMAETSLGLAAAAHLVAGTGAFDYIDLDAELLLKDQPVRAGYVRSGGKVVLSDKPGLGVEVLEEKLERVL